MEQITLRVHVPQSVAIAAGVSRYGTTMLPLTDENLADLSPIERECLGAYLTNTSSNKVLMLPTPATDWPAARAVIAAEAAALAEERARAAARREEQVVQALAAPLEAWLSFGWGGDALHPPSLMNAPAAGPNGVMLMSVTDDDRVIARRAELEPLYKQVRADWAERTVARYLALPLEAETPLTRDPWCYVCKDPRVEAHHTAMLREQDRRAAEREAVKDRAKAELRAFAARFDDLKRAATEGYDVEGACVKRVATSIGTALGNAVRPTGPTSPDIILIRDDTAQWDLFSWVERVAPRSDVLDLRERVEKTIVPSIERPSCIGVEVLRAMRVTVTKENENGEEKKEHFTAIVVIVTSPVTKDWAIIVPAEE